MSYDRWKTTDDTPEPCWDVCGIRVPLTQLLNVRIADVENQVCTRCCEAMEEGDEDE